MTPHTTTPPMRARSVRPARRLLVGLTATLAAVGVTGAAMLPAAAVHAERAATSSEVIAGKAAGAIAAFVRWETSGRPLDYVRYVHDRDAVAELIAEAIGLPESEVVANLAGTSLAKQHVVLAALSQLGVPYRSLASKPGEGFDCSGLTSYAYGQAGLSIPRSSGDQIRASHRVERAAAEAGDLVQYPGHVGIFLGGNIYVHSPQPGRDVEVVVMPDRSFNFGDVFDV